MRNGRLLLLLLTALALAAPAAASADPAWWTIDELPIVDDASEQPAVDLTGTLTWTNASTGISVTCDAAITAEVHNDADDPDSTGSPAYGAIDGATFSSCTTNVPGCVVSGAGENLPWTVYGSADSGVDTFVELDSIGTAFTFSGGGCLLGGATVHMTGTLTAPWDPGSSCVVLDSGAGSLSTTVGATPIGPSTVAGDLCATFADPGVGTTVGLAPAEDKITIDQKWTKGGVGIGNKMAAQGFTTAGTITYHLENPAYTVTCTLTGAGRAWNDPTDPDTMFTRAYAEITSYGLAGCTTSLANCTVAATSTATMMAPWKAYGAKLPGGTVIVATWDTSVTLTFGGGGTCAKDTQVRTMTGRLVGSWNSPTIAYNKAGSAVLGTTGTMVKTKVSGSEAWTMTTGLDLAAP